MHKFSAKETYLVTNTLNCLPFILDGHAVLIDMRNETSVAGRIDASGTDGYMNIHLVDAVYIDRNGQQYPFEQFMVRQRMLRKMHLPAHIEAETALREWFEHGRKPKRKPLQQQKGKRTFKQKRAMTRHQEILDQIQASKEKDTTPK